MNKHKERQEDTRKKIEELEARIQELDKKAAERDEFHDKYVRILAEYDNAKKRMEKENIEIIKFSHAQILSQLLPIIDDFDRAHEAAKQHKQGEVFSKGVEMILSQLHKLLENDGIEKVKTVGEKFDPHVHESISMVETNEYPEDTVVEELSPGYKLHGRLLRAAKVKISSTSKTQEKEGDKEND